MAKLVVLPEAEEVAARYKVVFPKSVFAGSVEALEKYIEPNDVVVYGGGEDISPSLYNERPEMTSAPPTPSPRDYLEMYAFRLTQDRNAKNLGICRGSQFLCAMSGYPLKQHVSDHGVNHPAEFFNLGKGMMINSTHHQQADLREMFSDDYEIIAAAPRGYMRAWYNRKTRKLETNDFLEDSPIEPEVVWYKKTRSLGIQGHPEYPDAPVDYISACREIVYNYLKKAA